MTKKFLPAIAALLFTCSFLHAQVTLVQHCDLLDFDGAGYLHEANGKLFFGSWTDSTGLEPWVSDGTASGTHLLHDVYPGTFNGLHSSGFYLTNTYSISYNNAFYFLGDDAVHGEQIWKSDGTDTGTKILKVINPLGNVTGPSGDDFPFFCIANGILFFQAYENTHGAELWKTDGTASGTVLVKDIYNGYISSEPSYLAALNNEVYFRAWGEGTGVELWKSDGTDAGTQMVKDIRPGGYSCFYDNSGWRDPFFKASGNYLYFLANIDSPAVHFHYWRTDGTNAGTIQLENFLTTTGLPSDENDYNDVNGTFYFLGLDGNSTHADLFKSDGTPNGTAKIVTNNNLTTLSDLFSFDGKLFFDGNQNNNYGLCESDGTTSGTQLISAFQNLTNVAGADFFGTDGNYLYGAVHSAFNGNNDEPRLFQSNGTAGGTVSIPHYGVLSPIVPFNGKMYFSGYDTLLNSNYQGLGLYSFTPVNVGVNEISSKENFSVFPNPADQFTVCSFQFTEGSVKEISLFDLEGRKILSQKVAASENKIIINVSDLLEGMYLLKVEGENFVDTRKISVVH